MKKTLKLVLSGCALILSACGTNQLNGSSEVSKCGENFDFPKAIAAKAKRDIQGNSNTERLLWAYDKEAKIISFMHDNLCNTCGDDWDLSLILTKEEDKYSLTSLAEDTSKSTNYKCGNCSYDLKTSAEIEEKDSINLVFIKQTKSFDESNGEKTAWSGKIDLTKESGEIILNENIQCM